MLSLVSLVLSFAILWPAAVDASSDGQIARTIIHDADWVSIATISTQKFIQGNAFVSLKSMCDGPVSNSTGIPYLYLTDRDVSVKDMDVNNNVTILVSWAQTNRCPANETFDPEDPRCAKVMLSGTVEKVKNSTDEHTFAQGALFERHPSMKYWPSSHNFFVAKIEPTQVLLLNQFGGIHNVDIEDYLHSRHTV
ncbi:protein CREG1 [Dendroctonus ponderosae]|uniref:CREG-like beta-barrel domain-containing protein n=1 Tax=Dendroctonus ponderosae TaxID=77166 RepID=A0AAR5Q9A0_DENPD|nr:protein CREG1 [Dendroctonus ponderosae]KAH1020686.1 hypothetical protein HUJ04_010301 [Dendroctonus ponderosae]